MNRLEFLQAVLPPNSKYCIAGFNKKLGLIPKVHFSTDIKEIDRLSDLLNNQEYNVYYGTGAFGIKDSKEADNVVSKQELYLDVDCGKGKGYPDVGVGLAALVKFCNDTNLPKPCVVLSGNGLNAHWIFEEPVACHEWRPVAENLKKLCIQHGLLADHGCTADVARILRMPDTINTRGRSKANVTRTSKPVAFSVLKSIIGEDAGSIFEQAKKIQEAVDGKPELDASTKALMGNRTAKFENIWLKSVQGTGCAQVKACIDNATTLVEPLWRAVLSIAQVCEDREWAIHKISEEYPGYDADATEKKATATGGPYRCETFAQITGNNLCEGCAHHITSPIQLGTTISRALEQNTVAVTENGEKKEYEIPKLPESYFLGKDGGVYNTIKISNKETKETEDVDVLVYPHYIYVFKRMEDPELGDSLWMRLHLPTDGVREFVIPQSIAVSRDKLRDELAKKGVISHATDQIVYLQTFIMRMVQELQHREKADIMHGRFGWSQYNTFIVGEREYAAGRVQHSPAAASIVRIARDLSLTGNLKDWSKAANWYSLPNMEPHAFTLACGFGSALIKMTTSKAAVVSLYSRASGSGKTTAVRMALSVWGDPNALLLIAADTSNSRINRLGIMGSLPTGTDEITNLSGEQISDFLYQASMGRGKHRMSGKTNEERVNHAEWANISITTSNASLVDKLRSIKDDPQGELARVLEIRVKPPEGYDKADVDAKLDLINTNYGVAGDKFIRYVMANPIEVYTIISEVRENCKNVFRFTTTERFIEATIVHAMAGLVVANKIGLVDIKMAPILQFLLEQVNIGREITLESVKDCTTIISAYLNEFIHSTLVVGATGHRATNSKAAPRVTPKNSLLIRYEQDIDALFITSQPFRTWCAIKQINTKELTMDLKRVGIVLELTKKRIGAGSEFDIGAVNAILIKRAKEVLGYDFVGSLDGVE